MLTFLIVIALIWLIGYLLFRVIIPLLFANFFRKMTRNMDNNSNNRINNKKEGEVNIDYIPDKENENDTDDRDGEYVDFEEIE